MIASEFLGWPDLMEQLPLCEAGLVPAELSSDSLSYCSVNIGVGLFSWNGSSPVLLLLKITCPTLSSKSMTIISLPSPELFRQGKQ